MYRGKTGIAILGCGRMGKGHAEVISRFPHATIVAAVDKKLEAARALSEQYDIPVATTKITDIIGSDEIDAVIISLPSHIRMKPVLSALHAGKHVFVEKPLALTTADADAMIQAAISRNNILVSGQVLRFAEVFVQARKMIRQGRIGNVLQVIHRRLSFFEDPIVPWWNNPKMRKGFVIHHHGSHSIDLLLWILDTTASSVFAIGVRSPEYAYEDTASILMNTANGIPIAINESFRSRQGEHNSVIIGSKSTIKIQGHSALFVDDKPVKTKKSDILQCQMTTFLNAVMKKRQPKELTIESMRNGVKAMAAAIKSCKTHKLEKV